MYEYIYDYANKMLYTIGNYHDVPNYYVYILTKSIKSRNMGSNKRNDTKSINVNYICFILLKCGLVN